MPARTFSGGNQQKAVLAKWLQMKPRVVLVEEPTQGIDVAARAAVHRRLQAIAEDGAGVLVASSEYEELADLCDRVLVMRDGVISECLTRPLSRDAIAHACYST
jgi:ribose transport system ATP-binding protein